MNGARAQLQALASALGAASAAVAQLAELLPVAGLGPAVARDLSVVQLAEQLGRSPSAVRDWIAAGLFPGAYRLPGEKRAGAWRVPVSAVEAFTERQRAKMPRQDAPSATLSPGPNPRPRSPRAPQAARADLSAWRRVRRRPDSP